MWLVGELDRPAAADTRLYFSAEVIGPHADDIELRSAALRPTPAMIGWLRVDLLHRRHARRSSRSCAWSVSRKRAQRSSPCDEARPLRASSGATPVATGPITSASSASGTGCCDPHDRGRARHAPSVTMTAARCGGLESRRPPPAAWSPSRPRRALCGGLRMSSRVRERLVSAGTRERREGQGPSVRWTSRSPQPARQGEVHPCPLVSSPPRSAVTWDRHSTGLRACRLQPDSALT